jgi:hypothetical protein
LPLALLYAPPSTEEKPPLAVLFAPPVTEEGVGAGSGLVAAGDRRGGRRSYFAPATSLSLAASQDALCARSAGFGSPSSDHESLRESA